MAKAKAFTTEEIAEEERRVDHDCFVNCCHAAWEPGHDAVRRWIATLDEASARIAELEAERIKIDGDRCAYVWHGLDGKSRVVCGAPRWPSAGVQGHDVRYGHMFVEPAANGGTK